MNNYLSHLVTRQLDPTIAVQPRLPSLFEPTPYAGWPLTEADFSAQMPGMSQTTAANEVKGAELLRPAFHSTLESPRPASEPLPPTRPMLDLALPPAPSEPAPNPLADESDIHSSRLFPISPEPVTWPVKSPPSPQAPLAPARSPNILPRSASAQPLPLLKADQPVPPPPRQPGRTLTNPFEMTDEMLPHRVKASSPVLVRLMTRQADRIEPLIEPLRQEHGTETITTSPSFPEITELPHPQQHLTPVSARFSIRQPAGSDSHRGSESAAPTIQVTIGRVEIRATPTPAVSTKKSAPASPVMTLEEYLRQRSGGGRR